MAEIKQYKALADFEFTNPEGKVIEVAEGEQIQFNDSDAKKFADKIEKLESDQSTTGGQPGLSYTALEDFEFTNPEGKVMQVGKDEKVQLSSSDAKKLADKIEKVEVAK